ncbi:MAG: DUF4294 domain-containing protein [Marinilabiliales bacterium]|nr:DUF4294 domain-containing protein [Marinilabiliales bacterium]
MPRGVQFDYRRHARLVYNVRRVYPYAMIVREEFGRINRLLETMPDEKDQRNFLQQYEKDLFQKYEEDMKKLTFSQGKILIKLIDRETQNTSYDLIRQYRGKFSATFWQSIARIFGANLKTPYDPDGEDYLIEQVIREIEAGGSDHFEGELTIGPDSLWHSLFTKKLLNSPDHSIGITGNI